LKESGISPTKTELDEAIEQIIAMEESANEQHDLENGEKRDKMEGDRLKAEEMHRTAMETLGKTQKRKSEEGQSKAKKSRSGNFCSSRRNSTCGKCSIPLFIILSKSA